MIKAVEKSIAFSVSINLSTRWQIAKKEVIFCQFEFVGVRWYGRVQIGKKQVIPRKIRCFPWDFIHLNFITAIASPCPTFKHNY